MLCVCEGNLCRSPVAELLLEAALAPDVEVTSAGTRAVVGAPIAPPMAALLASRSVGSSRFRAHQLQPDDLRQADVVLTMTLRQRAWVVELVPAVVGRTFTLRELARLLTLVDPAALSGGTLVERFRQALPAAAAQRRYLPDPAVDEIDDPYGRSDAAYRRAFTEVVDAVDRISAVVGAPR